MRYQDHDEALSGPNAEGHGEYAHGGWTHVTEGQTVQGARSKRRAKVERGRSSQRHSQGQKVPEIIALWRAVNTAYTSEFGKIGIKTKYTSQPKTSKWLVTQRTGTY